MLSQTTIETAFEAVSDAVNREAARSKILKFEMSISRGDDTQADFII